MMRLLALALFPVVGCFAVTDLDRFHAAEVASDGPRDLKLRLIEFGPHDSQLCEFRIVDATNVLRFHGTVLGFDAFKDKIPVDFVVHVPRSVSQLNKPNRLDLFCDMNGSGHYDGTNALPADHAWRIFFENDKRTKLVGNTFEVTFAHHGLAFKDIDEDLQGNLNPPREVFLGARVVLSKMDAHVGKLVQVRVAHRASGDVVGLFRFPRFPGPTATAQIRGVLDLRSDFRFEIFVDVNGNRVQDAGDKVWLVDKTSGTSELTVSFDPAMPTAAQGLGPP